MPKACAACGAENVIQAAECSACSAKFGAGNPATATKRAWKGWVVLAALLAFGLAWGVDQLRGDEPQREDVEDIIADPDAELACARLEAIGASARVGASDGALIDSLVEAREMAERSDDPDLATALRRLTRVARSGTPGEVEQEVDRVEVICSRYL